MCTDRNNIYRVSISFSRICSITAPIGTSSLWKIPADRAASALVFSNISEKCSTLPAPLEAITGMEMFSRIWFASSISNPLLVPSQLTLFHSIISWLQVQYSGKNTSFFHLDCYFVPLFGFYDEYSTTGTPYNLFCRASHK